MNRLLTKTGRRRGLQGVLLVVLVGTMVPAWGYVLMGEHVLDLMVKALGQANTLEVVQTVTRHAADDPLPSAPIVETVRMRFPYEFRADAVGDDFERQVIISGRTALMAINGVQQDALPRHMRYADILMLKPRPALVDHLRMLGVDVSVSSLGRFEDRYCYVIGAQFPNEDAAQLWVNKDTFHPFRLLLPPNARQAGEGPVEIRYRNWGFVQGTAYPMHILMMKNHQVMEEIRVDRVQVDLPLTDDLFDIMALRRQWSDPAVGDGANGDAIPTPDAPSSSTEPGKKN